MSELEKETLIHILKRSAEIYNELPAVSYVEGEPITYRSFYCKVKSSAEQLKRDGFSKGERIAVFSENQPNWGIAYFAVIGAGCTAVPILPDFTEYDVKNILKHSGSKAVFVSKKLLYKVESVDGIKKYLIDNLAGGEADENLVSAGSGASADYDLFIPEEDEPACIIYTSGTTGKSKGVMLTHKNIVSNALSAKDLSPIKAGDTLLSILPLSHTYEFTLGFIVPFYSGACVYYLSGLPTPKLLMPALKKVKPALMLTVPLIIEKIYRKSVLPSFKKSKLISRLYSVPLIRKGLNRLAGKKLKEVFGGRLEFFGIGGAPVAPDVEQFMREAHFPYAVGYGLTETSPLVAGSSPYKGKFRAIGPPIRGVEIRIDNPDPETGEGEIQVRGPNVMAGYYKNREETEKVITEDGFFKTGDLGYIDKDNYLFIRGRLKNMILGPSGENIYPEEIEALINEYNYVDESIVYSEEGRLIARIRLNRDEVAKEFDNIKKTAANISQSISKNVSEHIQHYLSELQNEVNKKLKSFSRLSRLEEEDKPFEKTPTQKIKRYLYLRKKNKKNPKK
ncbi:MAG: long-chain fatty acid--CoA ligase [Spirochaetes bacterium]|nr:MAG: long-chain fatty acid--CoA ligase [Spirochaetota bacterium]